MLCQCVKINPNIKMILLFIGWHQNLDTAKMMTFRVDSSLHYEIKFDKPFRPTDILHIFTKF